MTELVPPSPIRLSRPLRSVLLLGAASCAFVACGSESECTSISCADDVAVPPPAAEEPNTDAPSGGGTFVDDPVGNGTTPTNESTTELEEACREVAFGSEASPVNVHIVLDRSVSMNEPVSADNLTGPTRWEAMTGAIRSFLESPLANGAKVGLQFFGLTNGNDDCSIEKYMTPAVEAGFLTDVRGELLAALDETRPGSLTPTGPALAGALAHARDTALLPENEGRATVVVLVSDGLPSECFPTNDQGQVVQSYATILDTLETYANPPVDDVGNPVEDPIRTYIVGTEDLEVNAAALAEAGGAQAYLVGSEASGGNIEADFLDALLSIVRRPLTCEIVVPEQTPDTGERIDFDQVRVSFTGATSRIPREIPRSTSGPNVCSTGDAWYYDNPAEPNAIVFCPNTCADLGAGDLRIELGCAPIIR